MILADKIVSLRKKAGWSQEELAEQLGVTRQSVSKWEGAQSIPDMDKVVQMSRLFGVTTDYLLYVAAVCALLVLVGIGCLFLVNAGVYSGAMEQLLEEGDYTRGQKKHHKVRGTVTTIYWLVAVAVFLVYTYGPSGNGQPQYSWIIWAVAGVLYAAVMGVVRLLLRGRKD